MSYSSILCRLSNQNIPIYEVHCLINIYFFTIASLTEYIHLVDYLVTYFYVQYSFLLSSMHCLTNHSINYLNKFENY